MSSGDDFHTPFSFSEIKLASEELLKMSYPPPPLEGRKHVAKFFDEVEPIPQKIILEKKSVDLVNDLLGEGKFPPHPIGGLELNFKVEDKGNKVFNYFKDWWEGK